MPYNIPDDVNSPMKIIETLTNNYSNAGALVLFGIFIGLILIGYFSEMARTGRAKIQNWLMISSFITTILSFILFLIEGFITLEVIGICIAFFLIFTTWALFTND